MLVRPLSRTDKVTKDEHGSCLLRIQYARPSFIKDGRACFTRLISSVPSHGRLFGRSKKCIFDAPSISIIAFLKKKIVDALWEDISYIYIYIFDIKRNF